MPAKRSVMNMPPFERRIGTVANGMAPRIARQLQSILRQNEILSLEAYDELSLQDRKMYTARALSMLSNVLIEEAGNK